MLFCCKVTKYFIFLLIFILPFCTFGRTVKIAVSHFDPPFVVQQGQHSFDGFDIAMMKYLCRKLGYECHLYSFHRNQLLDEVEKGNVDLAVSNLVITKNSSSKVNFSTPYIVNKTHIIGLKKSVNGTFSLDSMNNDDIGITDSVYSDQINELKIEKPIVKIFDQDDDLIQSINNGKIDFALVDTYTANYWHLNSSGLIQDFGCPVVFESASAIAVNPNDKELIAQINGALLEYQNSQQFLDDYRKYLHRF
jgi:ABC-type amino acid transport substrate-binding protein